MSASDVYGNNYAGELAGKAAASTCVLLNVSSNYLYYTRLVRRIQKRLAAIICNLPVRRKLKTTKVEREPPPVTEDLINSTSHIIYESAGRLGCARCRSSSKEGDP